MFDWLRNLRKTEEEKQQERLTAYIDDELSAADRQAFERDLADNDVLRATVEAEQQVKLLLSQAPRLRAPRNFTLDPAVYGVPQRPSMATRLYPQLRVATAVMAVLLVGVISLEFLSGSVAPQTAAPAQDVARVQPAAEPELYAVEEVEEMAESAEMDMEDPMTTAAESAPAAAVAATSEPVEELAEAEEVEESTADGEAAGGAEVEIQEAPTEDEDPPAEAAANDDAMADEAEEEGEMEMADEAADTADDDENTAVAPRPEPTETVVRVAPTPTLLPTPTIETPPTSVGATVAPLLSPPPAEVVQPSFGLPFLRIAQIVVGLATAVLLALTLYFRRRL